MKRHMRCPTVLSLLTTTLVLGGVAAEVRRSTRAATGVHGS